MCVEGARTHILTPPSSLPSNTSSSGRGTTPRTWRYFRPLMDSSERQRSVSAEGRAKGDPETEAETELGRCALGVLSNGFGMGPEGVDGIVRRAKKVMPTMRFGGQIELHDTDMTQTTKTPGANVPSSRHPSRPISKPPRQRSLQACLPLPIDRSAVEVLVPFSAGVASTVSSPPDDGPGPVDEGPGPSREGVDVDGLWEGEDCFWGERIVGRSETRVKELVDEGCLGRAKGLALEGEGLGAGWE